MNTVHKSIAVGMAIVANVGVGCGAATLPPDQLASTQASIRAAQEVGAQDVPKADLQLRLAKEGVAQAQKFAEDGDDDLGKMQLDRAKADAELAVALARQAAAQKSLDEVTKNTASTMAAVPPAAAATAAPAATTAAAPPTVATTAAPKPAAAPVAPTAAPATAPTAPTAH